MDEELEYECPECGAYFPAGAKKCPSCGTEFDWEGDEEETVEEIAPESIDTEAEAGKEEAEEISEPQGEAVEEEYEEAPGEEPEVPREEDGYVLQHEVPTVEREYEVTEKDIEPPPDIPDIPPKDPPEGIPIPGGLPEPPWPGPPEEPEHLEPDIPKPEPPEPPEIKPKPPEPPKPGPSPYLGIFSIVGIAFIILTVAALISTIIALRWDTWISGAAEENIGEHQMLYVYMGVAGIVVCAIISVVDILRNRKGERG